ncbi:hypothetical protein HP548_23615 [Paenibacillus taichungensis]|uniref:Phosphoribosyl transferase-like protein n=1 Tax=Paenibacillus taichungensis TaxID=484184 RepID=A0ABX2MSQ8_9BACL|nr:phosphoribosyltransferase [Paenibacillus taichungensis]NUU57073.1 hypothetical protein [Paenibacillus taichungensis]
MSKLVLIASSSVVDSSLNLYTGIKELFDRLNADGDTIFIVSHNGNRLAEIIALLGSHYSYIKSTTRWTIRQVLEKYHNNQVVYVGSSDVDLQLTASKKILLFHSKWSDVQEEKTAKYGHHVEKPSDFVNIMKILNNQSSWFYELKISDKVNVFSLTKANSMYLTYESEKELIDGFNRLLKTGDTKYYDVLLLHFLASIVHNNDFLDVDFWGTMPSSGTQASQQLELFKDRVRHLMSKKLTQPLFVRHTATTKSHHIRNDSRIPCDRHFETICLNPFYKKKLKNKTVCILDDYLTNGTSFETLRNLLEYAGVKRIIFVSLGRFKKNVYSPEYVKQDYKIEGDVFSPGYSYEFIKRENINGTFNDSANEELRSLHAIINSPT